MPEFTQPDLTCDVDFNNAVDSGRLIKAAIRRMTGRTPVAGERVFLTDGEGNTCWANVDHVDGALVYFAPDDSTWISGAATVQATGVPQVAAFGTGRA